MIFNLTWKYIGWCERWGKCKCLKQMAGGVRALISGSHLEAQMIWGAICSHHFLLPSPFFPFWACKLILTWIIFMICPLSCACPSILTDKEGYLWGAYSRHIGLDKRVTELLAIIWENAKVDEILAKAQWSVRVRPLPSAKVSWEL